jgi:hypothetical protein
MKDKWMQVENIGLYRNNMSQYTIQLITWSKRRDFGTHWIKLSVAKSKIIQELYGN